MLRLPFLIAVIAILFSAPAVAESAKNDAIKMVQASKPETVLAALKKAGYEDAQYLPRDEDGGIPAIEVKWDEVSFFVLIDDCDEAVPDYCQSVAFSMAWDRKTPMSSDAVARANREFRYITVWLDDDGDPYAQWVIFTGEGGIPQEVFGAALERYLDVVAEFWDVAFENDGDEESDSVEDSEGSE